MTSSDRQLSTAREQTRGDVENGPGRHDRQVEILAEDEDAQPVALRYADAYQYQNMFGPLIADGGGLR